MTVKLTLLEAVRLVYASEITHGACCTLILRGYHFIEGGTQRGGSAERTPAASVSRCRFGLLLTCQTSRVAGSSPDKPDASDSSCLARDHAASFPNL